MPAPDSAVYPPDAAEQTLGQGDVPGDITFGALRSYCAFSRPTGVRYVGCDQTVLWEVTERLGNAWSPAEMSIAVFAPGGGAAGIVGDMLADSDDAEVTHTVGAEWDTTGLAPGDYLFALALTADDGQRVIGAQSVALWDGGF